MTKQTIFIFVGAFVVTAYAILQFYQIFYLNEDVGPKTVLQSANQISVTSIPFHREPRALNPVSFVDATGKKLNLKEWPEKVVLLNIWATWCAPCREEMPTLDRLQQQLGGQHFEVVALSIDRGGMEAVQKFYDQLGIKNLAIYVDETATALVRVGAYGIPATLLLSPDGQELGRLVGPTTWDSVEMINFLETTITDQFAKK